MFARSFATGVCVSRLRTSGVGVGTERLWLIRAPERRPRPTLATRYHRVLLRPASRDTMIVGLNTVDAPAAVLNVWMIPCQPDVAGNVIVPVSAADADAIL
jgi:hypothetical protein